MRITILGCGASAGVPLIGCDCPVCTSDNPKNTRTRVSVWVEVGGKSLLIDTSPDLRQQALTNNITHLDAVLYTHEHGDHSHGIDDLKRFNFLRQEPLPIYGDDRTMALLQQRFPYVFLEPTPEYGWFRACLVSNTVTPGIPFTVEGVEIIPFEQQHGKITTLGYRIGDFAYSTDVNQLDDTAFAALEGVKTWIVDCQTYSPPFTHSNVERTLSWIERVNPVHAIFTHMGHELEYEELKNTLPEGVEPGYDGMVLTLS